MAAEKLLPSSRHAAMAAVLDRLEQRPDRNPEAPSALEQHFSQYRPGILQPRHKYDSPNGGKVDTLYMDCAALAPGYGPIRAWGTAEYAPTKANVHTATSETGANANAFYDLARESIKNYVGADARDILMFEGSGMTAAVNKAQRLLGFKAGEQLNRAATVHGLEIPEGVLTFIDQLGPDVSVTHREHHSNQTSWLETTANVDVMTFDVNGEIDIEQLDRDLAKDQSGRMKIAAVTAASNVTGLKTPVHEIAKIMHKHGGYIFVDYAAGAPYLDIDMHPEDENERLDVIYFSGEKFTEGPNLGVLVMSKDLYAKVREFAPDRTGGGTVEYTDRWEGRSYHGHHSAAQGLTHEQDTSALEAKEDGGTPPIDQAVQLGRAIALVQHQGLENIQAREHEIAERLIDGLSEIPEVQVLEGNKKDRLGIVSFYMEKPRDPGAPEPATEAERRRDKQERNMHHNLVAKILSDDFGIQTRGGCSCAGTYGHVLLGVDQLWSREITSAIEQGDNSTKPGWVRVSPHQTATNQELDAFVDAVGYIAENWDVLAENYTFNPATGEFTHKDRSPDAHIDRVREIIARGDAGLVPHVPEVVYRKPVVVERL